MRNEHIEQRAKKVAVGSRSLQPQFTVSPVVNASMSEKHLKVWEQYTTQPLGVSQTLKVSAANQNHLAHSSQLAAYSWRVISPSGVWGGEGPALSTLHFAVCYFFTLCPSKAGHLPQGRMSDQLRFLARDSRLATRSYLKRNSTVKIDNKLLEWGCFYNASFSVFSKAGCEAGELAFRACELLLN